MQTGDSILLRAYKWRMLFFSEQTNGMLCFSEHTNEGCYSPFVCSEKYSIPRLFALRSIASPVCSLWEGMLCFSEHTNGGCYASQNIPTGDALLLRTKQTGMLYFWEHTNGGCYIAQNKTNRGCYASQNIHTGDAMLPLFVLFWEA
jgi:hypothetical protein